MPELRNAYALVVGIASYRSIRKLPYTDDARDVSALLRDPEVCGYTRVVSLEESAATREAILAELDRLAEIPAESTVLVYFSGHGGQVVQGERPVNYLLPFETVYPTEADLARTAISSGDLTAKLNRIAQRADRLTIILDCCHAGGIGEMKDLIAAPVAPGLSDEYVSSLGSGRGRVILAATRSGAPAYVTGGARHGVFTGLLIEGLRGGARGYRGVIRVGDLFDFVQEGLAQATPPQHPVYKAEFEQNYPIALHLGGTSGTGATVKGGLEVLIRLAKDPQIKAVIVAIADSLKAARERIGLVVSLKRLHDGLHDMQVNRYDQIVHERERFADDAGAAQNIWRHANRVATGVKQLRNDAVAVYPDPRDAAWVEEMEQSAAKVTRGARGGNAELVDEGIWGLNDVLSTIPSQINTDLLEHIRAMNLRELFRALLRVQDEMVKLRVEEGDVRNFAAGGRDLGRLDRDLDDLMSLHDRWQEIDNRMRRIENNWRGNPRELDLSWPKLSVLIGDQIDSIKPPFQDEIRQALGELGVLVAQPGRDAKLGAFRWLRDAAAQWFYEIDKALLGCCNELEAIKAALSAVFAAVLESNA